MKRKIFRWAVAVFLIAVCFVSCGGKTTKANDFGFYEDLDDAKKIAKKHKKDILLFVTMNGYDYTSKEFCKSVLLNDGLKSLLGDKFVFVHFDFGEETYNATEVKPGATKTEQTEAENKFAQLMKNMQLTRMLNIQTSPTVFIMTEDGYVVRQLYCDSFETPLEFANFVNEYSGDLEEIKSLVAATKKGSVSDRMNAINSISEKIDANDRTSYASLFGQAPEIDKKKETGLVSKIYFEAVLSDCLSVFAVGDYGSAIQILVDAAQGGNLEGKEKQEAYYMAGYILVTAGSDDVDTIVSYFTLAIQAYPESENALAIQETIDKIVALFEEKSEEDSVDGLNKSNKMLRFFDLTGAR